MCHKCGKKECKKDCKKECKKDCKKCEPVKPDCSTYDYVICGGGSAASLMARKLSDFGAVKPGVAKSVLVLELGINTLLDHKSITGYTPPPPIANDPDLNTPNYLNPIINDPVPLNNTANGAILSNLNDYAKVYPTSQNSVDNVPFNFAGQISDNVLTVTSFAPNVTYPVVPTTTFLVPGSKILGPGVDSNTFILRSLIPTPVTYASGDGTTITYNCTNTFAPGDKVVITGSNPAGYNLGTLAVPATVASANATQFTILNAFNTPWVFPAVGVPNGAAALNVTVGATGILNTAISSITSDAVAITNVVSNGTTIVYTAAGHTFLPGQSVIVTGVTSALPSNATNVATAFNFNGAVIASVVPGVSFTLNSQVQATYVSGGFAGRLATFTTSTPHNLLPLQTVTISQVAGATQYNVANQLIAAVPSATTFQLALGVSNVGTPVGGVVSLISGGFGRYKLNVAQNVAPGTTFTSGDRNINYGTGLGWGGGGNHYFSNAFRSTPAMYNTWASITGNSQWLYGNLLGEQIFQKVEDYKAYPGDPTSSERGTTGETSILQLSSLTQVSTDPLLTFASVAFGLPFVEDYNTSAGVIGLSPHQLFGKAPYYVIPSVTFNLPQQVTGSYRVFSFDSYLKLGFILDQNGNGLRNRPLKFTQNTIVDKVLFHGKKAVGVRYIDTVTRKVSEVYAKDKVILCASAIGTPQILQRSGVGPKALLQNLGIKVLVDSPQVGARMTNHYNGGNIAVGNAGNNAVFAFPSGRAVLDTDLHGLDSVNGINFVYPNDSIRRYFAPIRNATLGGSINLVGGPTVTHNINGVLKIQSKDPWDLPFMDWRMFSDDLTGLVNGSDLNIIMTYNKLCRQYATYAGLNLNTPGVVAFTTDALLAMFNRINGGFQAHCFGTCSMGSSVSNGVVDGNLNVFGTDNLMVADTSVFPVVTEGNPNLTVLTLAMKACQILGVNL